MRKGQSIIGWYGGKFNLIKHILPFPVHTTYIEVFAGSLVVLFNKVKSPVEIANDINSRLINMYLQVKKARREFLDYCKNEYGLDSREVFDFCKENVAENEVEDAARFFYLNYHSFSQMNESYHGLSFTGKEHWHRPYYNKLERLDEFYERIKFVQFENQDFRTLLKRCDQKETLLYLDPPYFKGGELYEYMAGNESKWSMKDFEDLREILLNLKNAKFVLSVDNNDFFYSDDWFYQPVERTNAASKCIGGTKSTDIEYIIRNFDPNKTPNMLQYTTKDKIKNDMIL